MQVQAMTEQEANDYAVKRTHEADLLLIQQ
jgi:hypothetical protein